MSRAVPDTPTELPARFGDPFMTWLSGLIKSARVPAGRAGLGEAAEKLAAKELLKQGYRILEKNVRLAHGEIDIVAQEGECLVIVEVKSLKDPPEGFEPLMHVDLKKRKRLVRLAREFCSAHRLTEMPLRFDIVSVIFRDEGPQMKIYKRAFDMGGRWA
jgi:putative endonuclease